MNLKNGLILVIIFASILLFVGISQGATSVTIGGKVMDWDNGRLIKNEDIKVQIISGRDVLVSGTTATNSSGEYRVDLNVDLKEGKYYMVNVSSESTGSYVKKEFRWKG